LFFPEPQGLLPAADDNDFGAYMMINRHVAAGAFAACLAASAWAETSVGVSIGISQPGVYGRIDIGNYPQPVLVSPQPIIIAAPPRVVVAPQPVYLYVPPGHQKNWGKYCGKYGACAQPVYFVQESWVRERYDEKQRGGGPGNSGNKGNKGGNKGNSGKSH
jgi:hypothetical protein